MELIEEMAKAIAANYSMKYTGRDEALACLPAFERWLRESSGKYNTACDCVECSRARRYMRGLADQIAAMAKEAKRG